MSDFQVLMIIMVAAYGIECLVWVPRRAVVFRKSWSRDAAILDANALPGTGRTGVALGFPLPPFGPTLVTSWPPISLSPEGACSFVAAAFNPGSGPDQEIRHLRFDAIDRVEATGRDVRVNGRAFVTAVSAGQARHVAGTLDRVRGLPRAARADAIVAAIRSSLDGDTAVLQWGALRARSRHLVIAATTLFAFLFGAAPMVIWQRGLIGSWMPILSLALLLVTWVIALFVRAHRVLVPGGAFDRRGHVLAMVLAPLDAIRAPDLLARDLFCTWHPVAVATATCGAIQGRAFAAAVRRDLRHPLPPADRIPDPEAHACARWFREQTAAEIDRLLTKAGAGLAAETRPAKDDDRCRTYCPRCLAQFVVAVGTCRDCGDLDLVAFDEDSVASA